MIFGLTSEKVINRVNKLIDEMGQYDVRIRHYEEQAALSVRLGLSLPGENDQIFEWRGAWDDIYGTLCEARAGLKTGELDYRVINASLPSVKTALGHFQRVLNQTDRLEAAGRNAARRALGKK